jgi:CheY-like chemotaxis protein
MPYKLLLADDSVTIQRVIELTFADEDVQVIAVGDGKKAIASIQAERPDIVLADVGMPERDGYEVAAFIKGAAELAHIPVLLLTGAFEPIDETRARAVGCDGVLVKPFEPQMVISRVKDLLAGRKPAGLWGASPSAQTPLRQPSSPAGDIDIRGPGPEPAAGPPGGSLEDYFDRLDAAFASLDGPPGAAPPSMPSTPAPHPAVEFTPAAPQGSPHQTAASTHSPFDDLGGWDPDLAGDPKKPVPRESPAIGIDSARGHAPVSAPAPAAVVPPPAPAPVYEPPSPHQAQAAPPPEPAYEPPPQPQAAPPAAPTYAAPPATPTYAAPPPAPTYAAPPPVSTYAAPPPPAHSVPPSAPAPAVAPSPPAPPPSPAAAIQAAPMPTLAEAFATLLSAEHGHRFAPSMIGAPIVTDQMVDEIVRRVIARVGDQAVRETVVDVAERLVREEISRIKGG